MITENIKKGDKDTLKETIKNLGIGGKILSAPSWQDLHAALAPHRMEYIKFGGGAVVVVRTGAEAEYIKSSDISKRTSLFHTEKRLGEYTPPTQPVETVAESRNHRLEIFQKVKNNKQDIINAVWSFDFDIPDALNVFISGPPASSGEMSRSYYKRYAEKRISGKYKEKPPAAQVALMEIWLIEKNKTNELIHFTGKHFMPSPPLLPSGFRPKNRDSAVQKKCDLFNIYHRCLGAPRYVIGGIKMFYENGEIQKIPLSKKSIMDRENGNILSPNEIISNMWKLQAYEEEGFNFYYRPVSEGRIQYISLDDVDVDGIDRLHRNGFSPAIVIESSPGNYQCIFKFDSGQDDLELAEEIARDAGKALNQIYGDVFLSAAGKHLLRAPGFHNIKTKPDNSLLYGETPPQIKIISASGAFCSLLEKYAADYFGYKALFEKTTKEEVVKRIKAENKKFSPNEKIDDSYVNTFRMHYMSIVAQLKRNSINEIDDSRVDFQIAQRVYALRRNLEEVEKVIYAGQRIVPREKTWAKYAIRTAAAAKECIDKNPGKYDNYLSFWQKVERDTKNTAMMGM